MAVPDLDKARVNPRMFETNLIDSAGLCKLLLFEHSTLHPTSPYVKSRFTNLISPPAAQPNNPSENQPASLSEIDALQQQHPSDYSDLYIPWGPNW